MKYRLILLFALTSVCQASVVKTLKDAEGWHLMVDSQPYVIHGISANVDIIGEDPNVANYRDWMIVDDNHNGKIDAAYDSWVDSNTNNTQDAGEATVGDFYLLQKMGVNTIRIYHHPSDDPAVMACYTDVEGQLIWNHALNKPLLRDLFYTYGIRVAMGDEAGSYAGSSCAAWVPGTDYTDPVQLANMERSIRAMVADSKDEPWLLMYVLGNENNYDFTHTNAWNHPTEYYTFIGNMVNIIHSLDPNHPVAISNGETQYIATAAIYAPNLDIWGMNTYRNPGSLTGFGTIWDEVAAAWDKPVILTEYGWAQDQFVGSVFNEAQQSVILKDYWCDIENHTAGRNTNGAKNALGAFQFQFMDTWWQNGNAFALYTGTPNNEGTGIAGNGSGLHSPFERQLRLAYYTYQNLWAKHTDSCPCPGRH